LALDTEIVVRPTVREPDGLAMSSRNAYLSAEERAAAPVLYGALSHAREMYCTGERDAIQLVDAVRQLVENEPLARLEYVCANDAETLEPLDTLDDERPAVLSIAARFGPTRLIDNVLLTPPRRATGPLVQP
jgi:pantoate--beta-alanine ligase